MIRTNLSTRPFYNSRLVTFWIGMLAIAVLAATLFNVSRVMRYSGSNAELASLASQDEAGAADMRAAAARLRASVDPRQIDLASAEAREANALIDRRTLSWTELFNRFETTLPADVRITAVHPSIDRDRRMTLVVTVTAREVDDVDEFMQKLDGTGVFLDVRSTQERRTEEGQIESTLEMAYVPRPADAPAPQGSTPASAPSEARRR